MMIQEKKKRRAQRLANINLAALQQLQGQQHQLQLPTQQGAQQPQQQLQQQQVHAQQQQGQNYDPSPNVQRQTSIEGLIISS